MYMVLCENSSEVYQYILEICNIPLTQLQFCQKALKGLQYASLTVAVNIPIIHAFIPRYFLSVMFGNVFTTFDTTVYHPEIQMK